MVRLVCSKTNRNRNPTFHSIVERKDGTEQRQEARGGQKGDSWSSSQEMLMKAEAAHKQEGTSGRKNND